MAAYGGLYNAATQPVTFTAANTYVPVALNTALPAKNVTTTGNTLVIPQAGDYEISYNLLMSTNAAADIGVAVRNNGTIIPQTRGAQTLAIDDTTTLAYDGRLSGSTIVTLPANSVLDLAVAVLNTLPTRFNAIINGNANTTLTVKKLNA